MFEQVELRTRAGDYVVTVPVPKFNPKAEVIQWGSRIFVLQEDGQYREGLMWVVTEMRRYE